MEKIMRIISIKEEEDLASRMGETKNDDRAVCYSASVTDL